MRTSFLQFVFGVLWLVFGGAAEDMLPRVLGVGAPVLLVASLFFAQRGTLAACCCFVVAAGAMEDALSGLPTAASVSFFLAAAWLVRRTGFPRLGATVAYPVYLTWLWVWTGASGGGIFGRLLVSVPLGFATAVVAGALFMAAERGAALHEAG